MSATASGPRSLTGTKAREAGPIAPWLWTTGALLLMLVISGAVGSVTIPPLMVLKLVIAKIPFAEVVADWPAAYATILYDIRLPNTVLIALAGMALGGSGAAYQGLFRNPLADPYIIGVASGAGLGAVLAMTANWPDTMLGMAAIPLAAFIGAVLTVAVVYSIARVGRSTPVTTLLLAGVAVGTFASSITSLLMLLSTDELHRAVSWLLGGFALGGWGPVLVSLPYLGIGLISLVVLGRPLNVLQFGDEEALQLGLDVEKFKLVIVIAASLVAATAVAFSGIIAFVGLIVPHLVRILWGYDYRRLIPLSILGGGAVLLAADVLARTLMSPRTLPVGVITSVVGAPFFLWLLRRAKREVFW
ncbi:MAG: FecCD family ABC transporter permease [Anaerolineales bacterium]